MQTTRPRFPARSVPSPGEMLCMAPDTLSGPGHGIPGDNAVGASHVLAHHGVVALKGAAGTGRERRVP